MPKGVVVPLESERLLECLQPLECFVCGTPNTLSAEHCEYCGVPMVLAHQANASKSRPKLVAVVGAPGSGKTTYLGMLVDMLSRQPHNLQVLVRGAFSISLQQQAVARLARCRFPHPTGEDPEQWNWVHCQVRRKKQRHPQEIIFPDISGRSLEQELEHPRKFPAIRATLRRASGAILVVDAQSLTEASTQQEFFALKLINYLCELAPNQKSYQRPVAIVLTKADRVPECTSDPVSYVKAHAAGFWQACQQNLRKFAFFASKVAGGTVTRTDRYGQKETIALRIEPWGLTEPFLWLLEQMYRRSWWPFGRRDKDPELPEGQYTNWAFPVL